MTRMLAEYRARIQANNEAVAKENERFTKWQIPETAGRANYFRCGCVFCFGESDNRERQSGTTWRREKTGAF